MFGTIRAGLCVSLPTPSSDIHHPPPHPPPATFDSPPSSFRLRRPSPFFLLNRHRSFVPPFSDFLFFGQLRASVLASFLLTVAGGFFSSESRSLKLSSISPASSAGLPDFPSAGGPTLPHFFLPSTSVFPGLDLFLLFFLPPPPLVFAIPFGSVSYHDTDFFVER